jgi:hypothetical protein
LLAEILNFQGTNPIWGMGSLSKLISGHPGMKLFRDAFFWVDISFGWMVPGKCREMIIVKIEQKTLNSI